MAPVRPEEDVYFPTLAKCFSGEQQLLSWKSVYTAICDPETASRSEALRSFLSDDATIAILSNPLNPYKAPSQAAKDKFSTATAQINVTPSTNGDYNTEEIKADAEWLSGLTKIDQLSALRITILEWQARPVAQLLGGFTEEEALSIQDAAGASNLAASAFLANSSFLAEPVRISTESAQPFHSSEQRKLRLITTYLSERLHICRVGQILLCLGATKDGETNEWLRAVSEKILEKQRISPRQPAFFSHCIEASQSRLTQMEQNSGWELPASIEQGAEESWGYCQATELVHILQLLFVHVNSFTSDTAPASSVLEWFQFLSQWQFFKSLDFPWPSQLQVFPLMQLLVCNISLAIFKVQIVLEDMETSYLKDKEAVMGITACMMDATESGSSPLRPAIFAWSSILHEAQGLLKSLTGDDELLFLEDAASPGASLQQYSPLISTFTELQRWLRNSSEDNVHSLTQALAQQSVDEAFELILPCIREGISRFGTEIDTAILDGMRRNFLGLIHAGFGTGLVTYDPRVVAATVAILNGQKSFWHWVDSGVQARADPAVYAFSQNEVLEQGLMEESFFRYPYETIPLLKFCRALIVGERTIHEGVPPSAQMLIEAERFMQILPFDFKGFTSIREEENANFIRLDGDLILFSSGGASRLISSERRFITSVEKSDLDDSMYLPAETEGNIVGAVKEGAVEGQVTVWHYRHSALQYLVTLLSTFVVGSNVVDASTNEPTSLETATEIIGLFGDLLTASIRSNKAADTGTPCAPDLLEALNIGSDRSQDTAGIVFAIFEQEILNQSRHPGNEGSLELLVNCTHFIHTMLVISPSRVWPWLARSRLLDNDGNSGSLATILIGTEMVIGRYDFLIGCIRLFECLVDDVVARSVVRKATSKAVTRFGAVPVCGSGTSDKAIANTLLSFGKTLTSVFENSPNWRYARIEDRFEITTRLSSIFDQILIYAYGTDDSTVLATKLCGLVASTAQYLIELFLSKSKNDMPTSPILSALLAATETDNSTLRTRANEMLIQQCRAILSFSKTLIRIGILLDRPWSHLEQQLFKATPILTRLYAADDEYKNAVVLLLQSLIRGATRTQGELPSLLGHLGASTAKNFLSILSALDKPLRVAEVEVNIWNLLSAVVSCRQQSFTIFLLTGRTPRETLKDSKAKSRHSKALLNQALDQLSIVDMSNPKRTIAILEFITSAQNNWSWAMGILRSHERFLDGLLAFLRELQKTDPKTEQDILKKADENKVAALVAEILALCLYSSRQIESPHSVKRSVEKIAANLTYLSESALTLPSYNASLHTNLKRNFESKFSSCCIQNFKRTPLTQQPFGNSYFYDVEFADKLLSFNSFWKSQRTQGFYDEFLRANTNLSLVESQILLLKAWQLLSVELSKSITKDQRLEKILIKTVKDCVVANAESTLPVALFSKLILLRTDLAFVLIQKLVIVKVKDPQARALFGDVWNTTRLSRIDFDTAFSGDQADYYRGLLKVLFLSLQFHLPEFSLENEQRESFRHSIAAPSASKFNESVSNQLLAVLSEVVAKGFRALAHQIHEDPKSCSPSDFGLITGILQVILRVPEMRNWHSQAALLFSNSNTSRFATSLFSWSDKLAIDHDPIYGELSILFLLELSSMQQMAESLAVEGILSQISSANLMNYFLRPQGMGPFDEPDRLFSIWVRGILPLCLNLLDAVGPPVVAEVSTFLNQFPNQLARAGSALNSRAFNSASLHAGRITHSLASEAHSLALISVIIDDIRAQGPALGIIASEIPTLNWDREGVKEDIEGWLQEGGRSGLRDRIVPTNEREVELGRTKPVVDRGAENALGERVVGELGAALGCLRGGGVAD